jgi:hypothetical protein
LDLPRQPGFFLIVGADSHAGKVLLTVLTAGLLDRTMQDVVELADGDGVIEQIAAEFADPADGFPSHQRLKGQENPRKNAVGRGGVRIIRALKRLRPLRLPAGCVRIVATIE